MEAMILFLYLGSIAGALGFATQWGKAQLTLFQVYVPAVLVAAGTIILLCFGELIGIPRSAGMTGVGLTTCLVIPSAVAAAIVIFYQLFHFKPAPRKIRWFGTAALSLIMLVFSPVLAMLLPYKGNYALSNLIEIFGFNFILGMGYFVMVLLILAFIPALNHQPITHIKRYTLGGAVISVVLGGIWYGQALVNNNAGAFLLYPIGASIPLAILAFLTLHDLALRYRQRLLPAGLAVTVSLLMVWSPYLGSVGIFESCNAIHRWQLEPVVAGLQNYNRDSARYPLEVKALMPFYLTSTPDLFCMNEGATSYYIEQCEEGAMFLLRDPNPHNYSRLRFDLGRNIGWRYLDADQAACTRFRP